MTHQYPRLANGNVGDPQLGWHTLYDEMVPFVKSLERDIGGTEVDQKAKNASKQWIKYHTLAYKSLTSFLNSLNKSGRHGTVYEQDDNKPPKKRKLTAYRFKSDCWNYKDGHCDFLHTKSQIAAMNKAIAPQQQHVRTENDFRRTRDRGQ
jgi:hypothetical protein